MLTPALYYPYIHFHDVSWLKASILCFQQIRRIVPPEFALNDSDEVKELRDCSGVGDEPLIKEEPAYHFAVWQAQERLLAQLREQPQQFFDRFTQAKSSRLQPFEMHRGKMMPLVDFLRAQKLAWSAEKFRRMNEDDWVGVHPRLGEAIMSTIAIAIAKEKGLGIVTSSGEVHRALADQSEDLVFQRLVDRPPITHASASSMEKRDELAMTILTTRFNVSNLTPTQIAELVREGKDLSRFKKRLDEELEGARTIPDKEERMRRLQITAREIVKEWEAQKKTLPKYALDALVPLVDQKLPSIATGLITGAASMATLGVGFGLSVGFAVYAGINSWQKFKEAEKSPLNYLSKIHNSGASLVSSA